MLVLFCLLQSLDFLQEILLTDLFSVYNCAIDGNGDLKYFDLDGINYYESKEEMTNSVDYKNVMGIVGEIENNFV